MTDLAPETLIKTLLSRYEGTVLNRAWGESAVYYNPGKQLPLGVYMATIKEGDGPNDAASGLNRAGVYRLNIGAGQSLYRQAFGPAPARPGKGGVIDGDWDFTALDQLTPHPVYGWMGWVAILNPSAARMAELTPLFDAAYAKAKQSFTRNLRNRLRQAEKDVRGEPQFC